MKNFLQNAAALRTSGLVIASLFSLGVPASPVFAEDVWNAKLFTAQADCTIDYTTLNWTHRRYHCSNVVKNVVGDAVLIRMETGWNLDGRNFQIAVTGTNREVFSTAARGTTGFLAARRSWIHETAITTSCSGKSNWGNPDDYKWDYGNHGWVLGVNADWGSITQVTIDINYNPGGWGC